MDGNDDDSIIYEGVYYSYKNSKQLDLYHLKYCLDSKKVEIKPLTEQSKYSADLLLRYFKTLHFRNPIENIIVSYKDGQNINLLIDTISRYYSNVYSGIRSINLASNNTRLYKKLTALIISKKSDAGRNSNLWH
jgi:hypothetical protein